ncbi:alanine--tRNA ligase [Candidatus Woesebacteria bacterium]|nr:alanine--tRNA ligase [Candidatus Woesebacteria bacterium]
MSSDEIREKYLKFFEERGHARIPPSPLVLEEDPTTLFTSAGMQPLVPYLKGEPHPRGKRLVDIQPSFRTVDIDEVGDNRHLTFFEMLGNWSLGDYFKKEQLEWCLEFFEEELGLAKDKLWASVFGGTKEVPKDEESIETWKGLGFPEERIRAYGVVKNWWSRSGTPEAMPAGEIGGPDTEVFFDFGTTHDPKFGKVCHPNCDCGRFIEIGNSVFIEYQKNGDGSLSELSQKNVDFGGGLERVAAAVNDSPDIFQIDIFKPVITKLEQETKNKYGEDEESDKRFRIVADHIRAAVAIASEGVIPNNKHQGYILRRLIRRAALNLQKLTGSSAVRVSEEVVGSFLDKPEIASVIGEEVGKFETALKKGQELIKQDSEMDPFDLYQSYGIPYEISQEIFYGAGRELTEKDRMDFEKKFIKHQELSRELSAGVFKGGLLDTSEQVVRLHTATHLIHAALRKVLGTYVSQKGSNITAERLRFDFSHPQKLTNEEIKKVEKLVNEQVEKNLPVSFEEKSLDEALKEGALAFFGERYGQSVKVYTIGPSTGSGSPFSKEICGGPHVTRTSEIGRVRIVKQEKLGRGVVRIYATAG